MAQEISQPTLFSAMKSKIALAAVGALLLLQLPTKSEAVKKPYVETYWESWIPAVSPNFSEPRTLKELARTPVPAARLKSTSISQDYPDDFGAFLKDVPVGPPGSCTGVNLATFRS